MYYCSRSIIQVDSVCPILIVKAIYIVNPYITHVENRALTRATWPIGVTHPISSQSAKNTDFTLFLIGTS
jgi:hypothetical protein